MGHDTDEGMVHFGKNLTCQLGRHIQNHSEFGIRDSGFGVRGSGFGVRGSGFGVRGSGFGIRGSGFGVRGSGRIKTGKYVWFKI